jgi:hypothetical protein
MQTLHCLFSRVLSEGKLASHELTLLIGASPRLSAKAKYSTKCRGGLCWMFYDESAVTLAKSDQSQPAAVYCFWPSCASLSASGDSACSRISGDFGRASESRFRIEAGGCDHPVFPAPPPNSLCRMVGASLSTTGGIFRPLIRIRWPIPINWGYREDQPWAPLSHLAGMAVLPLAFPCRLFWGPPCGDPCSSGGGVR